VDTRSARAHPQNATMARAEGLLQLRDKGAVVEREPPFGRVRRHAPDHPERAAVAGCGGRSW
jgi:hypothetical protein